MNALAERILYSKSGFTRVIERMEETGLVPSGISLKRVPPTTPLWGRREWRFVPVDARCALRPLGRGGVDAKSSSLVRFPFVSRSETGDV